MKILVVDDNPYDRKILRANLEHHNCEVIEAADGQEGLELAQTYKPDVIISDALMPRIDGFQFLRSIKKDESLKKIPFIFYSATYTGQKEIDLAISSGAKAYIIKPMEFKEFWKELNTVINKIADEKTITVSNVEKDEEYLRRYSYIVAAKLEEKIRELEDEIERRKKAEETLREKVKELEDFYNFAVNRELKMKELKEEITNLKTELSEYKKELR